MEEAAAVTTGEGVDVVQVVVTTLARSLLNALLNKALGMGISCRKAITLSRNRKGGKKQQNWIIE